MDEFLNKNKVGLPEIQQWVEDKMPDIVKDLTRICRIDLFLPFRMPNSFFGIDSRQIKYTFDSEITQLRE